MKRFSWMPLFLFFFGCNLPVKQKPSVPSSLVADGFRMLDSAKKLVQSGDVIFRDGDDDVSAAARSMNRKDTSFSHCGLLQVENDTVFVYHSIGGNYNPSQKLRRDPLDSFCNPAENRSFGIYRFSLDSLQRYRLAEEVHRQYQAGLKFDLYFNYQSDDVMYCSEFVFKSLDKAAGGTYSRYVRTDTMPWGVTTDDIYLNENCRLVERRQFIRKN